MKTAPLPFGSQVLTDNGFFLKERIETEEEWKEKEKINIKGEKEEYREEKQE